MRKKLIIIAMLLLPVLLWAQAVTHYRCDFEGASECAQWTLDAGKGGPQCENHWAIGAPSGIGLLGSTGLYVYSASDRSRAWYQASRSTAVLASRALTLQAGTYRMCLDWLCAGGLNDAVYVLWVPDSEKEALSDPYPAWLPLWVSRFPHLIGRNAQVWQSGSVDFTVSAGDEAGRVVVLWYNEQGTPVLPASRVDNIEIMPIAEAGATVQDLRYVGHNGRFEWQSSGTDFEVVVISGTDTIRTTADHPYLDADFLTDEKHYDIYVRSVSGDNHGTWCVARDVFVWIKGRRCIEYLDLTPDNSGVGKCFTGTWESKNGRPYESLKERSGMVDKGYLSDESQHTIHFLKDETDPRTGGQLRTVPDGEVASVRLNGHWRNTGNQTSTVEYEYHVEPGNNELLVLKYAAVLEHVDDGNHSEYEQPRFKLEVLRRTEFGTTEPVDDGCTNLDLKAGFGDTKNWHVHPSYRYDESVVEHTQIHWCDWQTLTISLRDYVNEDIIIRLTAYSCVYAQHFGYVYYTLACTSGSLPTRSCEDDAVDHFTVPEGFEYRWYRQRDERTPLSQREILSTSRTFNLTPGDTTIYLVDLVNPYKKSCYYTLEANPNPYGPVVRLTAERMEVSCQNAYAFTNKSGVFYTTGGKLTSHPTDTLQVLFWDFGDGTTMDDYRERNIEHIFPDEGGDFDVHLVASMADGLCVNDTFHLTLHVPDLTAFSTGDTLYTARICDGDTYVWPVNGRAYRNVEGPLGEQFAVRLDSVIERSEWGCERAARLHLTIDPQLRVNYADTLQVCADDARAVLDYTIMQGYADSVFISFPEQDQTRGWKATYAFAAGEDIVLPLPEGVRIDYYHPSVFFRNAQCPDTAAQLTLALQYPSAIVLQRYGYLAVADSAYNGGYSFSRYEWYSEDSQTLLGTSFYLPTEAEKTYGTTYYLLLTREGETTPFRTCPVYYDPTLDVRLTEDENRPRKVMVNGILYIERNGKRYSVL